jgi:hypothetical protein
LGTRKGSVNLMAAERFVVGQPFLVTSKSPSRSLGAVFEDDGETGWFYALRLPEHTILQSAHVYNAASVVDRHREFDFRIQWSEDGFQSTLLINGLARSILDLSAADAAS